MAAVSFSFLNRHVLQFEEIILGVLPAYLVVAYFGHKTGIHKPQKEEEEIEEPLPIEGYQYDPPLDWDHPRGINSGGK